MQKTQASVDYTTTILYNSRHQFKTTMRLEALNNSQLLQESERLTGEIPHAQETAQTLGTDEGVERFRYSQSSGLELPFLIRRVGRIRHRIVSGIVPALERRRQQVQSLIENYPRRLAQAEGVLDTIREGLVTIYTPEELSLAEQALRQARSEFKPIEEITPEVTASPISSPTPKPYKHLNIPEAGDRVHVTLLYEGDESRRSSRTVKLTPNESAVLMALARAAVSKQKRLRPKELAERAFKKAPAEVGLGQIMAGLRWKLNREEKFVDSKGAKRGPAVEYEIAEDVHIRSEKLQEEKEEAEKLSKRGERLNKLRSLIIKRKGVVLTALFEQLVENIGEVVTVESVHPIFQSAKIIRERVANLIIDGHKYEVRTSYPTRERGLGYSLVEIAVPVLEKKEEQEDVSRDDLGIAVPPVEDTERGGGTAPAGSGITPPAPLTGAALAAHLREAEAKLGNGDRAKDTYGDIRKKVPTIDIEEIGLQAAYIFVSRGNAEFVSQEIQKLAGVAHSRVMKAARTNHISVSRWEGHHPFFDVIAATELAIRTRLGGRNLTVDQRRQVRDLAEQSVDNAEYLIQQKKEEVITSK